MLIFYLQIKDIHWLEYTDTVYDNRVSY